MPNIPSQRGFTLVELIMVIVIIGIIGGMVSVFMKSPIDAYIASGRRAAMTDVADTVVRRMARDIHKALPNSIRPLGSSQCIEFIPTRTGGRYRAAGPGALDFVSGSSSFNMLGSNTLFAGNTIPRDSIPPDQQIAIGDVIVVYNLGIPGADAYFQNNTADVVPPAPSTPASAPGETQINISRSTPFPLESGSNRFHVIPANEQVVSYVCAGVGSLVGGDGPGTLYRITSLLADAGSTFSSCPVPVAGSTGTTVLANNVSTCSFAYDAVSQRNAIVQMTLGLTRSGETVTLYHEVHVDNTP